VPLGVSKESDQVPATFAGFVSEGGVCGESCAQTAPDEAKGTASIKIENANEYGFMSKSPLRDSTQRA
jgi:hypothetical protein